MYNIKNALLFTVFMFCYLFSFSQNGVIATSNPIAFGTIFGKGKDKPGLACRGRGVCTTGGPKCMSLVSWNDKQDTVTLIVNAAEAVGAGFGDLNSTDIKRTDGPDVGDSTYTFDGEYVMEAKEWGRSKDGKICANTVCSYVPIAYKSNPVGFIMLIIPVRELNDNCQFKKRQKK